MAHLTNFSFEFSYEIFTEYASQLILYHGAKKSKMTKNSNQGGSCLERFFFFFFFFCKKTNGAAKALLCKNKLLYTSEAIDKKI